jgi:osmotically-inducible protein OsmY
VIGSMVRLLFVVGAGAIVVASIGCRGDTGATPERQPDTATIRARSVTTASAAILVPQNPADTNIRRDLNLAIARDTDLRNRLISFIVANGDVSVTGTVQTEQERRKINDLAMNIGGVKSVANALLVAE